ncbi:MAG TPA: hypothetical protein VLZ81_17165 [Blastocatellia bacterium]|nr:hypothetical protein [Blastocatellia bacterium]
MAKRDKAQIEENATRIVNWLSRNPAEFEGNGVSEDSLTGPAGLSGLDDTETALDLLENREVVVREPDKMTTPHRILVKPGRIWPQTRDDALKSQPASQSN